MVRTNRTPRAKRARLIAGSAGAIDTPLPKVPEANHILLDYAPVWIEEPRGPRQYHFKRYPRESLDAWHKRHGLD